VLSREIVSQNEIESIFFALTFSTILFRK